MFPQVSADPSAIRERGSANRPLNGASQTVVNGVVQPVSAYTQNVFTIPFSVSYEADLFGRVRHNVEAAKRRSEEHTSELQSHLNLVCRLLLEKKKITMTVPPSFGRAQGPRGNNM